MGMVEDRIRQLVEENGTTFSWLAGKVGMSKSGFYKMVDSGSTRVDVLHKIAEVFKVPIDTFFTSEVDRLKNELVVSLKSSVDIGWSMRAMQLIILATIDKMELLIKSKRVEKEQINSHLQWMKDRYAEAEKFMTKDLSDKQVETLRKLNEEFFALIKRNAVNRKNFDEQDFDVMMAKVLKNATND